MDMMTSSEFGSVKLERSQTDPFTAYTELVHPLNHRVAVTIKFISRNVRQVQKSWARSRIFLPC
jgi:hypothetical protein